MYSNPASRSPLAEVSAALADTSLIEPVDAIRTFFRLLSPHLGAPYGFFALSARIRPALGDPLHGWRSVLVERFTESGEWESNEIDEWQAEMEAALESDVPTQLITAGPYVPRVRDRRDVVPDRANDDSPSGLQMRRLGIAERLVAGIPLTRRSEAFVGFDRPEGSARFSEADRALAFEAIHTLVRHGRSLALLYGLVGDEGVHTKREREVLAHLLHGASEAQAAHAVGISQRNCHQRVVRVYRQLGVSSRSELSNLWFGDSGRLGTPEPSPNA
jgi:DNA-binding CsgD family transcriptional regulator